MGLCLSKKIVDFDDLNARISELEQNMDTNRDGVITRQEMENYMTRQLKLRETEMLHLKQENEALKDSLRKADQKYEILMDKINKGKVESRNQTSRVSNAAIEKQIQMWLDDPHTNFSFIPDRAEMYAYKKMLSSLLGGMEKLFENFSIEFIGHKLVVTMQPIE